MIHSLSQAPLLSLGRCFTNSRRIVNMHACKISMAQQGVTNSAHSEHRRQVLIRIASLCMLNASVPVTVSAEVPSTGKKRDLSPDQLLEVIKVWRCSGNKLAHYSGANKPIVLLIAQELISRSLQRDFSDGQYYITGKLDQSIFADDCEFIDPTTNVKGPGTYSKAVAALFDHETSRADLISIEVLLSFSMKWACGSRKWCTFVSIDAIML